MYVIGQVVEGMIHKVEPFGLMIKLDDQIHGLAHISDLSDKPATDIKKFLEAFPIGETKKFEIISMDPAEHRLGLKLQGVAGVKRGRKKDGKENKEDKEDAKDESKEVKNEAPVEVSE